MWGKDLYVLVQLDLFCVIIMLGKYTVQHIILNHDGCVLNSQKPYQQDRNIRSHDTGVYREWWRR